MKYGQAERDPKRHSQIGRQKSWFIGHFGTLHIFMHIHLSHGPESNSLGNYTFFKKLMMDKNIFFLFFFSQIWSHLDSNNMHMYINKFTDDCREIISRLFAALRRIGHAVLVDCIKSSVWFMVKRCRLIAWVLIEIFFGRCSMSQIMFVSLLSEDEERTTYLVLQHVFPLRQLWKYSSFLRLRYLNKRNSTKFCPKEKIFQFFSIKINDFWSFFKRSFSGITLG